MQRGAQYHTLLPSEVARLYKENSASKGTKDGSPDRAYEGLRHYDVQAMDSSYDLLAHKFTDNAAEASQTQRDSELVQRSIEKGKRL